MSESILPWITPYLVGVAETHGADISALPKFGKKKKVQVLEILTYHEGDVLWAMSSDKVLSIPVKFTKDAVETFLAFHPISVNKCKGAVVYIKDFKPIFTRIPLGKQSLSADRHLALECDAFGCIGSVGAPRFGNPKAIDQHPDLSEWSKGLRQDGGAANCLKNRKQAQSSNDNPAPEPAPLLPASPKPAIQTPPQVEIAITKQESSTAPPVKRKLQVAFLAPEQPGVKMKWISGKMLRPPPPEVAQALAALKVPQSTAFTHAPETMRPTTPKREQETPEPVSERQRVRALLTSPASIRSATPLLEQEWPPSEAHDQEMQGPESQEEHDDIAEREQLSQKTPETFEPTTSYVTPPTPAQRGRASTSQLPPSSPPPNTQLSMVDETLMSSYPTPTSPYHHRRVPARKVPRPCPPVIMHTDEPVILAPNSDTSYSQSQSQSQSQALSQPFVRSTQDVVLSQLPSLARSPARSESIQIDDDKKRDLSREPLDTDADDEQDDNEYRPNSLFSIDATQDDSDSDHAIPTKLATTSLSKASADPLSISKGFAAPLRQTTADSEVIPPPGNSVAKRPEDLQLTNGTGEYGSRTSSLAPKGITRRQSDGKQEQQQEIASLATGRLDKHLKEDVNMVSAGEAREGRSITPAKPPKPQDEDIEMSSDDCQTRSRLLGLEAPSKPVNQTSSHERLPRRGNNEPLASENASVNTPAVTSSRTGTIEPMPHVVHEVQHDAQAWKAPSFMKKARLPSTNGKVKSTVQEAKNTGSSRSVPRVLNKANLVSALPSVRPILTPRKDGDTSTSSRLEASSTTTTGRIQASGSGSFTKNKKRGQEEEDASSEMQTPLPKKRKLEEKAAASQSTKPKQASRLHGWTAKLNLKFDELTPGQRAQCVDWEGLLGIWRRNLQDSRG